MAKAARFCQGKQGRCRTGILAWVENYCKSIGYWAQLGLENLPEMPAV
ncbi:hypothetical protein [Taklimakanibacter albus]|uniref:Uncharacterized protein n=1 Tax=Taklimakanibacter albus TaxID=2800327 RepID=A0ACC5RCV7_9HYPH|nr:hypothetical protein [Aestuariivirga sp. YIM B02566]MBK1870452.1 hypothetical protein [Aestuariivirga sp. YIM B02566]